MANLLTPPLPMADLLTPPLPMAEIIPNPLPGQITSRIESKLIDWLRMVQKEHRLNGDKRIQSKCYEDFELFSEEVRKLCRRFGEFKRAIRPIGSSSGLISTSSKLKEDINNVVGGFGSNSAKIWRDFSLEAGSNELPGRLQGFSTEESATLQLPQTMDVLSDRLIALISDLCDIPQFYDQRLTDALLEFHEWLGYRAECIESHQPTRLVQPSTVCQYIGQVMKEMTEHVSKVEVALSDFVKGGVGPIRDAQEKSQTRLQNISTVATLLSGVTATALQYTSTDNDGLKTPVMGLWTASLILSIASAINSQLAIHWRAAMYRSPRSALPIWASFLLDNAPLGFLVLAVLAFSVGLLVWTFTSGFAISVKTTAAVITCTTFFVLFAIIIWEAIEWGRGRRSDSEPTQADLKQIVSTYEPRRQRRPVETAEGTALEEGGQAPDGTSSTLAEKLYFPFIQLIIKHCSAWSIPRQERINQQPGDVDRASDGPKTLAADDDKDGEVRVVTQTQEIPQPRLTFQEAAHQRTLQEDIRKRAELHQRQADKLRTLRPVHKLPIFHPSGHDIHFSPDGKRLAVSQLDGSVTIWNVDQFDEGTETTLAPCCGRFAWSPNSSHIVIITKTGMSVLETKKFEGVSSKTGTASVVAWLQSSSGFIAIIGNDLHIYDTQLSETHPPIRDLALQVRDVATIPQLAQNAKELILVLGTLREDAPQGDSAWIPTKTGVKRPKFACAERWLIVVELGPGVQRQRVAVAPILADARHICVSSDGQFALISYGDESPPELWRLRAPSSGRPELVFRGRFFTPVQLQLRKGDTGRGISGKARFCGESDEWVMATDGESNIYIWDRLTRLVLHTLRGTQIVTKFMYYNGISNITSTERRGNSKGTMVASACREGGVVIWEETDDGPAGVPDSSNAVAHA